MKSSENLKKLKSMNVEELNKELKSKLTEATLVTLKIKVGKEKNVSLARKNKKNIARIKTIIGEKEAGATNE